MLHIVQPVGLLICWLDAGGTIHTTIHIIPRIIIPFDSEVERIVANSIVPEVQLPECFSLLLNQKHFKPSKLSL